MPERIQLRRTKGWRMPPNTMKVTRPGPWGNPFKVGVDGDAAECVAKFRQSWMEALKSANTHPRHPPMPFGKPLFLGPLKGKNLACWCRPGDSCHADILLEIANS